LKNIHAKAIIHGHFYQPPREDPWIDSIEPQPSAYPFRDWNVRITSECYAPNCFSRVLDKRGRIRDIINNYQYLSFNFGPTLLSWMEREDKEVYDLIIEADKRSIDEHHGHGNAIAQIYNHVIMPLQNYEDKKTQIIWGLKDFEHRYGRKSEGIWLSETAIDYETIDLLIDHGLKFVVLSPEQASEFRKIGDKHWSKVSDSPISTKHPYKIIREHGELGVFYFDKRLSTSVSFEHLLHNSDDFALRIKQSMTSKNDVVIIASDGEIFGHHEPFGDMCLAALIKEYCINQKQIELLNFGEYLELYPAEYETKISLGDDGLGSSWSCFHGVGRWYKDCGCHTGGEGNWTQNWRGPLRKSFDIVKESLDNVFITNVSKYLDDPWSLRNRYIEYILEGYGEAKYSFIRENVNKDISDEECSMLLTLLESQKYGMFMYTSCAWFFSDVSGIETVQNIKYAYKAVSLIENFDGDLKNKFENTLQKAKSNLPENGEGKWILDNWVYPHIQDFPHIANNFVALSILAEDFDEDSFRIFKTFGYENFNYKKIENTNNFFEGNIEVFEKNGYRSKVYNFLFNERIDDVYQVLIIPAEAKDAFENIKNEVMNSSDFDQFLNKGLHFFTDNDLVKEVREFIIDKKYRYKTKQLVDYGISLFNENKSLLSNYRKMNVKLPDIYKYFLSFTAQSIFYNLSLSLDSFPDKEILIELIQIFDFLKYFHIKVDLQVLKDKLSTILYNNIRSVGDDIDSKVLQQAVILIEFCNKVDCILEKSRSENVVFRLLKDNIDGLIEKIDILEEDDKAKYIVKVRNLIILSDHFNINTEKEKQQFFEHFKNAKETITFDKLY